MIESSDTNHGRAINFLAKVGKIQPVSMIVRGVKMDFNSMWAATEYIHSQIKEGRLSREDAKNA